MMRSHAHQMVQFLGSRSSPDVGVCSWAASSNECSNNMKDAVLLRVCCYVTLRRRQIIIKFRKQRGSNHYGAEFAAGAFWLNCLNQSLLNGVLIFFSSKCYVVICCFEAALKATSSLCSHMHVDPLLFSLMKLWKSSVALAAVFVVGLCYGYQCCDLSDRVRQEDTCNMSNVRCSKSKFVVINVTKISIFTFI